MIVRFIGRKIDLIITGNIRYDETRINDMRITNLIFHIIAVILMLPDLLFIGINSLMGLGYCNNIEMIMVLTIDMIFGAAFICSTVWEIILVARYKTTRPKSYMINELIIHGLTILCFAIAVIYIIRVHLTSTYPHEYGFSLYINLAGFGLSLAGIILTLILGIRRNKKAAAVIAERVCAQKAMRRSNECL